MISHDDVDLELLVRSVRLEADGVVSLELENETGADLPAWTPGAHTDLSLGPDLLRQYSLSGDPHERHRWRVAVLREPSGRGGSIAVHDRLRPGARLHARGPRNNFELSPAPHYVFIAGGIGITPILPMVREAHAKGAHWSLLYGGRSLATMAFRDELTHFGERVELFPQDLRGHLPLSDRLKSPRPDTLVYACGPEPMLEAAHDAMSEWLPALHVERFRPVPLSTEQLTSEHPFEVEATRSGVHVSVPVGVPIIRALETAGVMVETSCEEGICGTCETKVLDGVPEHRDSLLSAEERAAGETMMICVSRCQGSKLVLDI